LHIHGRGAKTDAFGRGFAVLSMQISTAGLRLRRNRLMRGIMIEVSHDAAANQEKNNSSVVQRRRVNIAYFLSAAIFVRFDLGRELDEKILYSLR
jgi:hypothetical protein